MLNGENSTMARPALEHTSIGLADLIAELAAFRRRVGNAEVRLLDEDGRWFDIVNVLPGGNGQPILAIRLASS